MLEDGHKYWYYKQFKLIRNLFVDVLGNISIFLKPHAPFYSTLCKKKKNDETTVTTTSLRDQNLVRY